jgi:hypothetical protein
MSVRGPQGTPASVDGETPPKSTHATQLAERVSLTDACAFGFRREIERCLPTLPSIRRPSVTSLSSRARLGFECNRLQKNANTAPSCCPSSYVDPTRLIEAELMFSPRGQRLGPSDLVWISGVGQNTSGEAEEAWA